jgi:competence protein ComEC
MYRLDKLTAKQWVLSHFIAMSLLFLVGWSFFGVLGQSLAVSFLDVGQGDAILIQTPEYKNILIDAGVGSKVVDELGAQIGFFDKTIDLFVLTHPDIDHYMGLLDVFQKYEVEKILMTGVVSNNSIYKTFLKEVNERDIEVIFASADRDIQIGENVYLDVLYPFVGQSFMGQEVKDKNNTSVTIRVVRRGEKGWENLVMLSGDAEIPQETELLLSGQDLEARVLKLGHHGSKTSTMDGFLGAVKPAVAVVSAGKDNKFGHPHAEVMEKVMNLEVMSTADEGVITLNF